MTLMKLTIQRPSGHAAAKTIISDSRFLFQTNYKRKEVYKLYVKEATLLNSEDHRCNETKGAFDMQVKWKKHISL